MGCHVVELVLNERAVWDTTENANFGQRNTGKVSSIGIVIMG